MAVLECYAAASRLVPLEFRRSFVLVGFAAAIAHGIDYRRTEDVDIATSPEAGWAFEQAVIRQEGGFRRTTDGGNRYECSFGFGVTVELLELGGPFIPRFTDVNAYGNGFIAPLRDLARFRAATVVGRGKDKDLNDFRKLLTRMGGEKMRFDHLSEEEMEDLVAAVEELGQGAIAIFMTTFTTWDRDGRIRGLIAEPDILYI